jgi:hypothetical protein
MDIGSLSSAKPSAPAGRLSGHIPACAEQLEARSFQKGFEKPDKAPKSNALIWTEVERNPRHPRPWRSQKSEAPAGDVPDRRLRATVTTAAGRSYVMKSGRESAVGVATFQQIALSSRS